MVRTWSEDQWEAAPAGFLSRVCWAGQGRARRRKEGLDSMPSNHSGNTYESLHPRMRAALGTGLILLVLTTDLLVTYDGQVWV